MKGPIIITGKTYFPTITNMNIRQRDGRNDHRELEALPGLPIEERLLAVDDYLLRDPERLACDSILNSETTYSIEIQLWRPIASGESIIANPTLASTPRRTTSFFSLFLFPRPSLSRTVTVVHPLHTLLLFSARWVWNGFVFFGVLDNFLLFLAVNFLD
jgi:hypothetical protein